MRITAHRYLDRGTEQVEDMMEQGMPFGCVEDAIETFRLPSDHKAALWLLAWSLRDPVVQLQDARLTVGLVAANGGPR
jgi:hypothetical protein